MDSDVQVDDMLENMKKKIVELLFLFLSLFFFFQDFIYLREGTRERAQARGGAGGEREAGSLLSWEPDVGLLIPGPWDHMT